MPVRTTIYLDERLLDRARRVLPPRHLSRVINQALAEKVQALERRRTEEAMREGYLATDAGRGELQRDWEAVDPPEWPG